ncbi:MAG: glycosyltransferase family 2 protein [Anaerolineaceae bacterium]|nr:MAG: glycosyltransferase family 2 protein [Anaerolineaceae bacterium]
MIDTPQDGLLSVIIPHWNAKDFLPDCLHALAAQTYPHIEVIVVDNGSTDGSQDYIRENHPDVRLIEQGYNSGFTGACNAGMQAARGEFVCLLNNDTAVDANWATAIIEAFERHPHAGSIASKMMLFDKRDHIHTAGDFFTTDGQAGNRGVWEKDSGQYDREEYVFGACGGSSAYRRQMLDQTGLLDDDFFFLLEDIDLAWRGQLLGWRCLYTPHAIVYHHLSATGGGETASYYNGRNLIFVLVKNLPIELWRKYRWQILRRQWRIVADALKAWRGAAARARLRGVLAGLRGLPGALRKRRRIQPERVASVESIDAILTRPAGLDQPDGLAAPDK